MSDNNTTAYLRALKAEKDPKILFEQVRVLFRDNTKLKRELEKFRKEIARLEGNIQALLETNKIKDESRILLEKRVQTLKAMNKEAKRAGSADKQRRKH